MDQLNPFISATYDREVLIYTVPGGGTDSMFKYGLINFSGHR